MDGPLRGLCYVCDREIVPIETDDGSFECPDCGESAVECPCEDYERWQGSWEVRYAGDEGPYNYRLTIGPDGTYVARRPGSTAEGDLVWAPEDHDGFSMRLEGTLSYPGAAAEYLGFVPLHDDSDVGQVPSFLARLETADGDVLQGSVWPCMPAHESAMSPFLRIFSGALGEDIDDEGGEGVGNERYQQDIMRGFEDMANGWPGLSPEDRERVRGQMRNAAVAFAPLVRNIMRPNGEAQPGPMGHFPLGGAMVQDPFLSQLFGMPRGGFERVERQGVAEPLLQQWLSSRQFSGAGLDHDWQCPICFDSSLEGLVAVCNDAAGNPVHAYHRECLSDWLARKNECPTCRRTPVAVEDDLDQSQA